MYFAAQAAFCLGLPQFTAPPDSARDSMRRKAGLSRTGVAATSPESERPFPRFRSKSGGFLYLPLGIAIAAAALGAGELC
jgi:hypothetical protein